MKKIFAVSERHPWTAVFSIALVLSFLIYFKTADGRFVFDFNSWSLIYLKDGTGGIFRCFGDRSPHFFYHLVNFTLLHVFWLNKWAWLVVAVSLNALNATLLFLFVKKMAERISPLPAVEVAAWSALLFLAGAHQAEAIVWGAALHYLFTTTLIFGCLHLFLKYAASGNPWTLALMHLVFTVAVFSLEIAIAVPLLLAALLFLVPDLFEKEKSPARAFFKTVMPQLLIVAAYFVVNKFRGDEWVGHYGAAAHLNFSPETIVPNFSKFNLKLFGFGQFAAHHYKSKVVALLETQQLVIAAGIFYALLLAGAAILVRKTKSALKAPALFVVLYAVSLAPVINLYFVFLHSNEQDRYNYFPYAFPAAAVAAVFFFIFKKYAHWLLAVYVALSVYFLSQNVSSWSETGVVSENLVEDFRWHDADRIFVLSIADNFRGAYLYRSQPQSTLAEAIALRQGINLSERIYEIAQFNMATRADKTSAVFENDTTIRVSFSQWGNWWWRGGYGALNYQTDAYSVIFDEWGQYYVLTLKNKQPEDVFIYQASDKWLELIPPN